MRSPDIVAIEEIQDNNGATNNGVVAADETYATFIAAIVAAGGPTYEYRQIDPVANAGRRRAGRQHPRRLPVPHRPRAGSSSTAPGGNATDRDRAWSATPRRAAADAQPGPDRSPTDPAFDEQPQAAGRRVHVARAHRVRGRQPLQLQGRRRPAVRALPAAGPPHRDGLTGATSRRRVVDGFVERSPGRGPTSSQRRDRAREIINDFEFSRDASTSSRTAACWTNLMETLPP